MPGGLVFRRRPDPSGRKPSGHSALPGWGLEGDGGGESCGIDGKGMVWYGMAFVLEGDFEVFLIFRQSVLLDSRCLGISIVDGSGGDGFWGNVNGGKERG